MEAIIGLPTDMFYNTGISTYVWIVTNRKKPERKGKVQLIDASAMWQKMRKSLGSKRKELSVLRLVGMRTAGGVRVPSDHSSVSVTAPLKGRGAAVSDSPPVSGTDPPDIPVASPALNW